MNLFNLYKKLLFVFVISFLYIINTSFAASTTTSDFSTGIFGNDLNGFNNGGINWTGSTNAFKFLSTSPVRLGQSTNAGGVVLSSSVMTNSNYEVKSTVYIASKSGDVSLIFRAVNSTNYYLVVFSYTYNNVSFYKVVSNIYTILYTQSFTPGLVGTTEQISISAFGNTFTVYQNGIPLMSVTDSTFTNPGYIGLRAGGLAVSTINTTAQLSSIDIIYPDYIVSGPYRGFKKQNANFVVVPQNGTIINGNIVITPSGGGLNTPIVLSFNNSSSSQNFSLSPTDSGWLSLKMSNSGGLQNPSDIIYKISPFISDFSAGVSGSDINGFSMNGINWTGSTNAFKFLSTSPVRLGQSTNAGGVVLSNTIMPYMDYEVVATNYITTKLGDVSLITRAVDSNNYYLGVFNYSLGSALIYKNVSGVFSLLSSVSFTSSATSTSETVSISVLGSKITLRQNGTSLLSVTDNTFTNPGYIGLRAGGSAVSTTNSGVHISNIYIDNVPLSSGVASINGISSSSVSLISTNPIGGTDIYTYQWYKDIVRNFTPSNLNKLNGATSLTLSNDYVLAGTVYYYKLITTDSNSNSVVSNEVSVVPHDGVPGIKIYADGDSVTAYPGNYTGYYVSDIVSFIPDASVNVTNVAVSGQSQAQMLSDISTQIINNNPDIVTIATYLNDLSTASTTLRTNIHSYIDQVLSHINPSTGLPPQLILMTDNLSGQNLSQSYARPIDSQLTTVATVLNAYNDYINNPNIHIVDNFSTFYNLGVDSVTLYYNLLSDQVHPNTSGYALIRNNMKYSLIDASNRVTMGSIVGPYILSKSLLVSTSSVEINWQTDKKSSTKINFGLTSSYTSSTTIVDNIVPTFSHSVIINNLLPNTTYHYQIETTDSIGNRTLSQDFIFSTDNIIIVPASSTSTNVVIQEPERGVVFDMSFFNTLNNLSKKQPVMITYQNSSTSNLQTIQTQISTDINNSVKEIKIGDKNTTVKQLQVFLNNNGYTISKSRAGSKGKETEYFGILTKNALLKYQKANKLKQTGVLDEETKKKTGIK